MLGFGVCALVVVLMITFVYNFLSSWSGRTYNSYAVYIMMDVITNWHGRMPFTSNTGRTCQSESDFDLQGRVTWKFVPSSEAGLVLSHRGTNKPRRRQILAQKWPQKDPKYVARVSLMITQIRIVALAERLGVAMGICRLSRGRRLEQRAPSHAREGQFAAGSSVEQSRCGDMS